LANSESAFIGIYFGAALWLAGKATKPPQTFSNARPFCPPSQYRLSTRQNGVVVRTWSRQVK
jgi:hypothetical protein